MKNEEEGLKDWEASPSRNRIRALSEIMHDIVASAEKQGYNFAEIMTAIDAFQIELSIKHGISPQDFEKGQVKICEHYERIHKRHSENDS